MPELPEVELLRRFLASHAVGERVLRLEIGDIAAVKTVLPDVRGSDVRSVGRYGKWLALELGAHWLCFHLSRAGWLRWYDDVPATLIKPGRSPIALRVRFESGSGFDLTEAGTKKRLAVHLVAAPADVAQIASLGPDPLTLSREDFARILGARNQQIKGALRDQSQIGGIGNAYSDEILWAARMSPYQQTGKLTPEAIDALYSVMKSRLTEAISSGGAAPSDLKDAKRTGLRVHGRAGESCPACGDVIREVSFADSALQYCPACQTGGKPLADRRLSRLLK